MLEFKLNAYLGSIIAAGEGTGMDIEGFRQALFKFNVYLGSIIAAGGTDMNIENRINKARSAFGMLSVVILVPV